MAYHKCASIYGTNNSAASVQTASGAIANFSTQLAMPLIKSRFNFKATQEAGTPTPQSPKAISGVSEISVYHLGGNFFNKNSVKNGKLINGSGNEVSYADWNLSDFIEVIEGSSYYLYGLTSHPNTNQDNFELFNANKEKVGFANVKTNQQPYVIPSGVAYIKCSVKNPDLDTAQFGVSQNLSYCPYSPDIEKYIINLGGTYYGGYVEQDKDGHRELVVTHNSFADMSLLDWQYQTAYSRFITTDLNSVIKRTADNNEILAGLMCPVYETSSANRTASTSYDNVIASSTSGLLSIRDTSLNGDLTALSTRLANRILIYPLAEPFTVALPDGQPIKTIPGINNIYADTGDTSLQFIKLGN